MKYADLHTDALTKNGGVFQVTPERLRRGGCRLQCFAIFEPNPAAGLSRALALSEKFGDMCKKEGLLRVERRADLKSEFVALLSVEGGGPLEGKAENLGLLFSHGVRLFTLTWNGENALGFPNVYSEGLPPGHGMPKMRETVRGLKPFGRDMVGEMFRLGIAVDVSHGSDKLFWDVAALSEKFHTPFLASHSNAAAVLDCPRNLTDSEIVALAECGGVAGLNFCADFLSPDGSAAGQREGIFAHIRHFLRTGGEEVLAIGSDFDGIPVSPYLSGAHEMPRFLEELVREFGEKTAEKIAFGNALRVLGDILPE